MDVEQADLSALNRKQGRHSIQCGWQSNSSLNRNVPIYPGMCKVIPTLLRCGIYINLILTVL